MEKNEDSQNRREVRQEVKAWKKEGSRGAGTYNGISSWRAQEPYRRSLAENDRVVVSDFVILHSSGRRRSGKATPETFQRCRTLRGKRVHPYF